MTDPIAEVRLRRAETKARQERGEGMADGWTGQALDVLLAEIDRKAEVINMNDERLIEDLRAKISELAVTIRELRRSEAQLQENLNICVAQKYEALAEVARLRAPPEGDVIVMVEALRDCDRPELPLLQRWQVNQVARAFTAYGDQRAREARATAIIAPPQPEGGEG